MPIIINISFEFVAILILIKCHTQRTNFNYFLIAK